MRTTLKDIARECGVDIATVSRALSGAQGVHEKTRERVLVAATRLNYRPNRLATGLITGKSRTLAMVISDIRNPFFPELARGAEDAAYKAGYDLILCNTDLNSAKQMSYVHALLEKRVEGILMSSIGRLTDVEEDELHRSGVPIVLINRPAPRGFSTVLADNLAGGFIAGQYLASLGHRIIGHLTAPVYHVSIGDRTKGFRKALAKTNAQAASIIVHGLHNSDGGYQMMTKLLHDRPDLTAVFTANDAMAFGAIHAIFDRGLHVPEDISVIGYDDVDMASIVRPPLTTIHQPIYEMGQAAVEVLLRHAKQSGAPTPEHRLMGVKLVERESCRRRTNEEQQVSADLQLRAL